MTDEYRSEEEKENKSDKKVDKVFLSKAKNSRDMMDKKLKIFENSIEDISVTITNGVITEKKELGKKAIEEISEETLEAQKKLDTVIKKIDDKEQYLTAIFSFTESVRTIRSICLVS